VFGNEFDSPATSSLEHPPRQETTYNRSRSKLDGPTTRHPQLCSPSPESCQSPDENSLRQTSQLRGLPRRRLSMAVSPNHHEGEIAKPPILMGNPVKGSHPDILCGMQVPAEP
jgi:hypothetical protein